MTLDDALMSPLVTQRLHQSIADGADVINGVMFRPDKPLHLYEPDYDMAREKGGGNVWAHIRGFRKTLFDALPGKYLKYRGEWVDTVTDYAIMLPLVEMAQKPVFIDDQFCYYHQRDPYPEKIKAAQRVILEALLNQPPAPKITAVAPTLDAAAAYR